MNNKIILNLTQHSLTKEQFKYGIIELDESNKEKLRKLLTFNSIDEAKCEEMQRRANQVIEIIENFKKLSGLNEVKKEIWCMIGGAPYFMSILEKKLKENGYIPCYAFSKRVVKEKEENGKVVKITEFVHEGLISC